jgi:hypothetical protein
MRALPTNGCLALTAWYSISDGAPQLKLLGAHSEQLKCIAGKYNYRAANNRNQRCSQGIGSSAAGISRCPFAL